MQNQYKYKCKIVGDDSLLDKINHTNPKIRKILKENYSAIFQRKDVLKKIQTDIEKYPDVPPFKNQLELYYAVNNQLE